MTNYFFYGIISDEDAEETWKVLHDYFEKLAREEEGQLARADDDGMAQTDD